MEIRAQLTGWTRPEPVEAMILLPNSLMNVAQWAGADRMTIEKTFADGRELAMFWKGDDAVFMAPLNTKEPVLIVKNLKTNSFYYVDAAEWATDFDRSN